MWLDPFMKLREELYRLAYAGNEVSHAVLLHGPDASFDAHKIAHQGNTDYELHPAHELPLIRTQNTGVHVRHYFYPHTEKSLGELKNKLADLHTWLEEVPKEVLPEFRPVLYEDRSLANLVGWTGVVNYLFFKYEEREFPAYELHFALLIRISQMICIAISIYG